MLTGSRVALRLVERGDVDALVTLLAEPEVERWWTPHDRARIERELFDELDADLTAYVITVDGEVVGLIESSEEPEADYRRASIDIAVSTRWHGTGVAVDALRTLIGHLIEVKGHHHLTIDPAVENRRAIACYEKVGFRAVGVLRQNERGADGTFHDTFLMDLVADDWRRCETGSDADA